MTGTYADSVRRVLIGRVVATCAALVVVVGTFLPWVRSGARDRHSYQIFSLVERLGYSSSGVVGWALRVWPVLPLMLVTAIALLWFHRPWTGVAVGAAGAVYAAAVAVMVRSGSPSPLIAVQHGPWVTLGGAALLLVSLLSALVVNPSVT